MAATSGSCLVEHSVLGAISANILSSKKYDRPRSKSEVVTAVFSSKGQIMIQQSSPEGLVPLGLDRPLRQREIFAKELFTSRSLSSTSDELVPKKLVGAGYWEWLSPDLVSFALDQLRGIELGALCCAHRAFAEAAESTAMEKIDPATKRVDEPAWRTLEAKESFRARCPARASNNHFLLLKDDDVFVMGRGTCGQLGLGSSVFEAGRPVKIECLTQQQQQQRDSDRNRLRAAQVAAGTHASLVLDQEGQLWAFGKLGGTHEPPRFVPHPLPRSRTPFRWISAGPSHCLAVDSTGMAWAWGKNSHGQLGLGSVGRLESRPRTVSALRNKKIVSAEAGAFHSLFLDDDGAPYACGLGADGRLGLGHSINSTLPERVTIADKIRIVSAAVSHSAAVSETGFLYAWGDPSRGALGHHDLDASRSPCRVQSLAHKRIVSCTCSMRKTYALDDDGFVWTLHGAPGSTPKKLSLDFRVRSLAVSDDDDTLILEKQQRSAGNNDTAEENAAAAFFLCNNKSGDVKRLV